MKILFSNPPWWDDSSGHLRKGIRAGSRWPFTMPAPHLPDEFRFGGYLPYPFFLGHAAAHTAALIDGAQVVLRDSIARGESYNAYFDHIAGETYDWIVVETATPSWPHDQHLLERYRALCPRARVILCGTLDAAQAPALFAAHANLAAIVQGEYDKQIARAIRQAGAGTPGFVLPHDLLTLEEMEAAPIPLWDEACAAHYWDPCPSGQEPTQLQLWTSRGCPFRCIFCVWPAVMTGHDPDGTRPRRVRSYSPAYVERHIRARLAAQPGIRTIYLDDDTFNLTDRHALAMSEMLGRIGLPWSAMCRVDTLRPDTWRAMRAAGCFGVKLGFESGSQHVLDHIVGKRLDLATAECETLPFLRSLGFTLHTTWTIGLPGETAEQQRQTVKMIERLYCAGLHDTHQLSGTAEVEGTPLHTLRTGGAALARYDGAAIGAGYVVSSDGQRKIEQMRGGG